MDITHPLANSHKVLTVRPELVKVVASIKALPTVEKTKSVTMKVFADRGADGGHGPGVAPAGTYTDPSHDATVAAALKLYDASSKAVPRVQLMVALNLQSIADVDALLKALAEREHVGTDVTGSQGRGRPWASLKSRAEAEPQAEEAPKGTRPAKRAARRSAA